MERSGRHFFLSGACIAAALLVVALGVGCSRESGSGGEARSTARAAPNVVLYMIDTLRRDRLGVYGYEHPTSPHMDALAGESVVFDHCYAPAPWTLPSVVSMLTSTYPVDHKVLVFGQQIGEGLTPLAEHMERMGYRTAAFVSNPYGGRASGLDRGYDHFERDEKYVDAVFIGKWLEKSASAEPFFIYVHTTEPHRPYSAPAELVGRFGRVDEQSQETIEKQLDVLGELGREDFENQRPLGTTDNSARQLEIIEALAKYEKPMEVLYNSGVAWADENVGRVIEMLKGRGLWEDTLLIVVSDHGEEFYEHGRLLHHQSLYDELIRVPMVWRFPGGEFGPSRVSMPASLIDIMPTLFDYLGHPKLAAECLGNSVFGAIEGAPQERQREFFVSSVRMNRSRYFKPLKESRGDFNVSVIHGEWKGIWNIEPDTFELYDRATDPGETTDVSARHPAMAKTMWESAREWLGQRPVLGGATKSGDALDVSDLDPETLKRLRTLGYVK